MAPAPTLRIPAHPAFAPPDYAPEFDSAFITIVAVFSFFGICFALIVAWIWCVDGMDGRRRRRRRRSTNVLAASGGAKRKRLEWYNRRRKSWKHPSSISTDSKFWRSHTRANFENDLMTRSPLITSHRRSKGYNTFAASMRVPIYSPEYSSPDDEEGPISPFTRRPPLRAQSTHGILAANVLGPKKGGLRRAFSMPGGQKRRPKVEGEGRRIFSSFGGNDGGPSRPTGLDVVVEEVSGMGTTPER